MSERREKAASKNKIVAYAAAIIIHVLIIGAMVFNFTSKPKVVEAFDAEEIDVVKATTIDESQIKHQQKLIKEKDAQKKREELAEKKRLEDLKKQAKEEKQRIADLKKQQEDEQVKTLELEKKRKAIALKAEQEKKQREKEKREAEKKQVEEKKIAEKKRLDDLKKQAEKKKDEEAKRKKQQEVAAEKARVKKAEDLKKEQERLAKEKQAKAAQDSFAQQLEAEEGRRRTATLTSKYAALVTKAINAKRTIAPDFESSLVAKLNIKLSPLGDVLNVSVVESSGNLRYDRDAEKAVRNASPLPIPSLEEDEAAHKTFQDVTLNIRMPNA